MDSIIGMVAKQFLLNPSVANSAISAATKMFLKKSPPQAASGILPNLPKAITDQFDENDRRQFTTTQDDITRYDLIKQLSEVTGIKDVDKLDELSDLVLDNIKQNINIDTRDGLDRQELLVALNDLYRRTR